MLHSYSSLALALSLALLLAACGDSYESTIRAPPISASGIDSSDFADESSTETGDETSSDERRPADMPAPDGADSEAEEPERIPPPEEPDRDFANIDDVVASIEDREVTLTAVNAGGEVLGRIRLRQDEKRRLWVESMYHDGFAWVGLEALYYGVKFHRSTLPTEVLKTRAHEFAAILQDRPLDHTRLCGLHIATAVSVCAVAAATGVAEKAGCPTSMHKAACRCLAPYPDEYVCES